MQSGRGACRVSSDYKCLRKIIELGNGCPSRPSECRNWIRCNSIPVPQERPEVAEYCLRLKLKLTTDQHVVDVAQAIPRTSPKAIYQTNFYICRQLLRVYRKSVYVPTIAPNNQNLVVRRVNGSNCLQSTVGNKARFIQKSQRR